ncbi:hypothetical protein C8N40_11184 [Pontibacter mucosus]|uniref:Uncharacterized protein n=1 Tax=Pontibacter mucosus TaxID=1649266 RepID=A0A2T5YD26_9BACT|nr:hypothetical protein [Pontibacter mucosus]PTX14419.1 hypothetical protein C8N40_11184 [Pontibacter mucosus]
MTQQEQTELHRLLAQLADSDFYAYGQALQDHDAFKRLQAMATAPRYPEGNEHHIRAIGWQELVSMADFAERYRLKEVVQTIHAEMQRRLLKLVPEGEAVTGDVGAESRES